MIGVSGPLRVCLIILWLGLLVPTMAQAQGKWTKLAPFPEPAEELLGAAANGKMYVFCGLAPGWKPIGMVYEYDPVTDKWAKKKPMPLLSHHVAFTEYRGKIYAFGGFVLPPAGPAAWAPLDNAWEYDPVADNWKALAPMPTRRGSPVAAVAGDKIYVIGGATTPPGSKETAVHPARPHVSVGTVEEYDPASNTWRARTSMPTPRNHATAGAVNGKIYVIGGASEARSSPLAAATSTSSRNTTRPPTLGAAHARGCRRRAARWRPESTAGASMSQAARARIARGCTRFAHWRHTIRQATDGQYCRRCRYRVTDSQAPSWASACTWSAVTCSRRRAASRYTPTRTTPSSSTVATTEHLRTCMTRLRHSRASGNPVRR